MSRKPPDKTARDRFAALLARHLTDGSRPATVDGEPWTYVGFSKEVTPSRESADNPTVSARSVSNWCKGTALPNEIDPILRALFGPAGRAADRHAEARETLREAFKAARAEKNTVLTQRAKRDPAGTRWIVEDERHAIDRTPRPTDRRAAIDPIKQQLQRAIRSLAESLAERAKRLANSAAWGDMATVAEALHAIVCLDPSRVPERLGDAYALLLRLGTFLETDIRLQRDPMAADAPLEADLHGLLSNLVRMAAPWLRGFPTVAALDDAAGKALIRADLFQPARDLTRIARQQEVISQRDAAELERLAKTADSRDFQGQKAGARAVGSAKNLMLAAAETAALSLAEPSAPEGAARSRLVERDLALLAAAEPEIEAIAATLPDDLRHALRSLIRAARAPEHYSPEARPSSSGSPIPEDVEKRARDLILRGQAPPVEWHPFIRRLDFMQTRLDDLSPLSGLTGLQILDLSGTSIGDLSPLAGLTGLQSLDLSGTSIGDLSPLAGLTGLQELYLIGTSIGDLSPLSGLTGLQELYLIGTSIGDLSPLSGLTGLQSLNLRGTSIADLSPLSALTGLQSLDLEGTSIADLSPLSGLTGLQSLDLRRTSIGDLSPLSGLTGLQILNLSGTSIADLSPLAGLTGLQRLYLSGTSIADLSPLSALTGLQSLDLEGTSIADLSPLSGLTGLQSLDLTGTSIGDLSPLAALTGLQSLYLSRRLGADVSPLSGLSELHIIYDDEQP